MKKSETVEGVSLKDLDELVAKVEKALKIKIRLWRKDGEVINMQIRLPNGRVNGFETVDTNEAIDILDTLIYKMEDKA